MVNIVPVDRERMEERPSLVGSRSSGGPDRCPLTGPEFANAISAMPWAHGIETEQRFCRAPRAMARHVRALHLAQHPFTLIRRDGNEQGIPAIDEDSGRIVDEVGGGGR
jgi:hypothetical protein